MKPCSLTAFEVFATALLHEDDRGCVRGGDWTKGRDGHEQARESEKQREQRALVRAREADRERGEIIRSDRMEDEELGPKDSRVPATQSARQGARDSGNGTSPPKKRKFNSIVWDVDDTKRGTLQALTLQAAPHISTRL